MFDTARMIEMQIETQRAKFDAEEKEQALMVKVDTLQTKLAKSAVDYMRERADLVKKDAALMKACEENVVLEEKVEKLKKENSRMAKHLWEACEKVVALREEIDELKQPCFDFVWEDGQYKCSWTTSGIQMVDIDE